MSTLRCVKMVPKFMGRDDNLEFHIQEHLLHELADRMMGILSSQESYIVMLEPMSVTDDLTKENNQYCQNLRMQHVVLCKDCAQRKKNKFCLRHMCYEDDYDFCSRGEQKEREGE